MNINHRQVYLMVKQALRKGDDETLTRNAERHRKEGFGWRYDGFSDWSTDAIFAKLRELGVDTDEQRFYKQAQAAERPMVLQKTCCEGTPDTGTFWDDFPFLAVEELWRRLTPNLLCPELLADRLEEAVRASSERRSHSPEDGQRDVETALLLMDYLELVPPEERAARLQEVDECGVCDHSSWLLCFVLNHGKASQGSAGQPIQVGEEKPSAETAHARPAAAAGPRSAEFKVEREAMVAQQIAARGVRSPDVLAALRHVPRHWFVPEHLHNLAYSDQPLPIGEDQTISQPYIVALMTESLKLTRESKVLEIGTGSGYQAAVLSEITPNVFTIEIVEPLARRAIDTLERRGYSTVQVRIGDGYAGWPERAPFDAIIVTCAPDHIPPKLIEQLKAGGRMCIPVGNQHGVQELVLATRNDHGTLERRTLIPVRFVPMTGEAQQ